MTSAILKDEEISIDVGYYGNRFLLFIQRRNKLKIRNKRTFMTLLSIGIISSQFGTIPIMLAEENLKYSDVEDKPEEFQSIEETGIDELEEVSIPEPEVKPEP
ncbi:hypothetical protein D922_01723, partial [Enterococcus faecalis 06-MB-DW-09]